MIYTLEFNKTFEGLLRVSASAGSNREQAIAIFEDDSAFLHLVRRASLNADVVRTLKRAVVIALGPARKRTICEGLELTDEQLMLWGSWDGTHCLLRQTRSAGPCRRCSTLVPYRHCEEPAARVQGRSRCIRRVIASARRRTIHGGSDRCGSSTRRVNA
jgi:hypothetical protein